MKRTRTVTAMLAVTALLAVAVPSASAQTAAAHVPNFPAHHLERYFSTGTRGHVGVTGNLAAMIADGARAAELAGTDWRIGNASVAIHRSIQNQLELRVAHCGETPWEVLSKPSSRCSPPTATPGNSMHQYGLAVDITLVWVAARRVQRRLLAAADDEFGWLIANAERYGFYNLPSEPWHWSTNGR